MTNYLYYDRRKSIELLEYYFFLTETYSLLLEKNRSGNILIQEFLDSLENHPYWELRKVEGYLVTLDDYLFWQSREISLEGMENFVAQKWNASEFQNAVYYTLIEDIRESVILEKDFKKQESLELNPEIFQFSKIISDLELALEAFSEEPEDDDLIYLTEDQLREVVKEVFPKVRKYFTN
jgi:hypothetical protein